jgi:hypothetical protein
MRCRRTKSVRGRVKFLQVSYQSRRCKIGFSMVESGDMLLRLSGTRLPKLRGRRLYCLTWLICLVPGPVSEEKALDGAVSHGRHLDGN